MAQGRPGVPGHRPAACAERRARRINEVICGARRHWTITWLRANNYPRFRYLIEERELTDEEAFRLADIENRDREDISDYERAVDYVEAWTAITAASRRDGGAARRSRRPG